MKRIVFATFWLLLFAASAFAGEILASCYAKIMPEIKDKMIALIKDDAKW